MGTRSDIIVQRADGSWKRIYCHWDGYLDHNGKLLFEHYNDQAKADALVKPGDLSSLAPKCNKPKGHSFDSPVDGYCVYYGRDRGEEDTAGYEAASLEEVWPEEGCWTEFTYVYASEPGGANEPRWYVGDPDLGPSSLAPLELALKDPANYEPKPDVKAPWGVIGHRDPSRAAG